MTVKIAPVEKDARERIAKLRDDQRMDRRAKGLKARRIVGRNADPRPRLTSEQPAKLAAIESWRGMSGRRGGVPGARAAAPGGAAL
jgi:hypothetical protein